MKECLLCHVGYMFNVLNQIISQEVKLNEEAALDALPFTNPGVTSSFKWTKNSKMVGDKSVLTVDKVTRDHCNGFYTCEVSKNKQLSFKVHHCLRFISK